MVSMQSSAQEVTMLFKLIAAAKDSWACLFRKTRKNASLAPLWAKWRQSTFTHETVVTVVTVVHKSVLLFKVACFGMLRGLVGKPQH